MKIKQGEDKKFTYTNQFDLTKNDIRTIPFPQQWSKAKVVFNIQHGIEQLAIEDSVLSSTVGSDYERINKEISVLLVFEAAKYQGIESKIFWSGNIEDLNTMDYSEEAKIRIRSAIIKGNMIWIPSRNVTIRGANRVGWFEIDPVSGKLVDTFENGQHTSIIESGLIDYWTTGPKNQFGLGLVSGSLVAIYGLIAVALLPKEIKKSIYDPYQKIELFLPFIWGPFEAYLLFTYGGSFFHAGFAVGFTAFQRFISYYMEHDPVLPNMLVGVAASASDPVVPNVQPHLNTLVVNEPFFTLPINSTQLASLYRLYIKNTDSSAKTYRVTFPNQPAGFTVKSSLPEVTIPAGETGVVGIMLIPNAGLPTPGTQAPFQVTITDTATNQTQTTPTTTFTTPNVVGITLDAAPTQNAITSGGTVNATLTVKSVGNVAAANIPLTLQTSTGLTVTGLPATVSLGLGETKTIPLTLTANSALNNTLTATITASYGKDLDGNPYKANASIAVSIRSAETLPIERCAQTAASAQNTQLAQNLASLAEVTTQLQQKPGDAPLCGRLNLLYDQLLALAAVNPGLTALKPQIQALRDLAAACNTPQLLTDSARFFTSNCPVQAVSATPAVSLVPTSVSLEPGQGTVFHLRLENQGTQPATFNLSLDTLPAGVTATLNRNTVTLGAGEVLDAGSANPVTLTLTQTLTGSQTFPVRVLATLAGTGTTLTASGLVRVAPSQADVVSVTADPVVIDQTQTKTTVTARILNAANLPRSALAQLQVVDQNGNVVQTLTPVAVNLVPSTETIPVNLGTVSITGLSNGIYRLRASLLTAANQPLPGRSAETLLFVGMPITATVRAEPSLVAPGNPTVKTVIEVTNRIHQTTDPSDSDVLYNLFVDAPVPVSVIASSSVNVNTPPELAIDGSLWTSWSSAEGMDPTPFVEGTFQGKCNCILQEIRMSGRRGQYGVDHNADILAGIFEVFDIENNIIFSSGEVQLPEPWRDITIPVPNLIDPHRIKFTVTSFKNPGFHVGFSELVALGKFTHPVSPPSALKADIIFIIDSSASMENKIRAVGNSLSNLTSNLVSQGIDARFALINFGDRPHLCLNFTKNIDRLKIAFQDLGHFCTGGGGGEAGLEAIRLALGEGEGLDVSYPIVFRPDARKILIITTDEDSDAPCILENLLPGQPYCSDPPENILGTVWQTEVDNTAKAVIKHQAFVNLIIYGGGPLNGGPSYDVSAYQYGDPASDVSNSDYSDFNASATLRKLEGAGYGQSLSAQVLRAGLISRSFDISKVSDPNFLDNFFKAKLGEVKSTKIDLKIQHRLPSSGFNTTQFSPYPTSHNGPELLWQSSVYSALNSVNRFEVEGEAPNLQPGESRAISTGSDVTAEYTNTNGQRITVMLPLPPVIVAAAHILTLDPSSRAVTAGQSASYNVILANPTSTDQTYTLGLIGLEGLNATLASSMTVPAGQTVTTPLTVNTSTNTLTTARAFAVTATTATGGISTAPGELQITNVGTGTGTPPPTIQLPGQAVDITLIPTIATAGLGTAATFTARVINLGDQTTTFNLAGAFPTGFSAKLAETSVTLLPGISNYRDVTLTVTPPPGTNPADYPFTVTATAAGAPAITDQAAGTVKVVNLGVSVDLSPDTANPPATLTLKVTNTGRVQETYKLELAGSAANHTVLPTATVTLAPGASQTLTLNVSAITTALPGDLSLTAIATAQSNSSVRDSDTSRLSINASRGLSVAFNPDTKVLSSPGPATFLLQVQNTGNREEAYQAVITTTNGPISAALEGLNGQPTQRIETFRLPALATGLIQVNANLQSTGTGAVAVEVISVDGALKGSDTATLKAGAQEAAAARIPTLSELGRWLLILVLLGGIFYTRRRPYRWR